MAVRRVDGSSGIKEGSEGKKGRFFGMALIMTLMMLVID